jgi:hypothetical protein
MPDEPTGRQQNPQHGNSRAYILDRLERAGRHDLADAIRADRVSAFAVACQMGWSERPANIGNGSRNQAKKRERDLRALAGDTNLLSQLQELWLGGDRSQGSVFRSREELVLAWQEHRDRVMALWGSHGRRPMAWWEFEAGDLRHPGYFHERSTLWRAGVLSDAERAELEAEWRQEFDAAREKGARERREAFEHHDIPAELVERWSAQKKRRLAGKRRTAEGVQT